METDAEVGRLLNALEQAGKSENTLVLFTSDNGCAPYINVQQLEEMGHFPSGPLRGYKSDAWEGGHRVPMIVRWPGRVAPGSTCAQLVHQADLIATLAEVVDFELPVNAGEDSFSMLSLFQGHNKAIREHAISCSSGGIPAVRARKWKYLPVPGSGGWSKLPADQQTQPCQLYNLEDDLGETNNLAAAEPKQVKRMQELLENLISNGRSTPGPQQPNDVQVKRYRPK